MKKERIDLFFNKISYKFRNISLLKEALSHPSLSQNLSESNYQRLEFFGDKVLSFIIAELLIQAHPKEKEGFLSKKQAYLVSGDVISKVAIKIGINEIINLSEGEDLIGGRTNKKNLEDCLEAVIGAIYFDSNIDYCRKFIIKYWLDFIHEDSFLQKDPVSSLQELFQEKTKKLPQYFIERVGGKDHKPIFNATININGVRYSATGFSKKNAQKLLAMNILENYQFIL